MEVVMQQLQRLPPTMARIDIKDPPARWFAAHCSDVRPWLPPPPSLNNGEVGRGAIKTMSYQRSLCARNKGKNRNAGLRVGQRGIGERYGIKNGLVKRRHVYASQTNASVTRWSKRWPNETKLERKNKGLKQQEQWKLPEAIDE